MKDIILFHGSRGGIDGNITPISRIRCDFGKGFYMGTDIMQAKGIVSNDSEPYLYTLKLKLSEIPEDRILDLRNDNKWIYTILANRKKIPEFNDLPLAKNLLQMCNNYDIIIGTIADDSMSYVMDYFKDNLITNEVLERCLKTVDYGTQYVAKSEFACSKIEILDCQEITYDMVDEAKKYEAIKRTGNKTIVNELIAAHRGEGYYLQDIIKRELSNNSIFSKNYQDNNELKFIEEGVDDDYKR